MLKMFKRLTQTGDTIVEVLIAITVVSAVLGGAYTSATRSLNGSRQSQERGEALKLAEAQLERLKSAGANSTSSVYTKTSFCIDDTNTPIDLPNAACDANLGGPTYQRSISRNTDTFTVQITWDKAGGGGKENSTIIYKLHK